MKIQKRELFVLEYVIKEFSNSNASVCPLKIVQTLIFQLTNASTVLENQMVSACIGRCATTRIHRLCFITEEGGT